MQFHIKTEHTLDPTAIHGHHIELVKVLDNTHREACTEKPLA
jgi:hypothetical protein